MKEFPQEFELERLIERLQVADKMNKSFEDFHRLKAAT
jgi:hypothetical protein